MNHEPHDSHSSVEIGSERSFAIVFAVVFLVVSLWPWLHGDHIRIWALVVMATFLATGLLAPKALRPLNRLWFRFGLLLHKVVSPVVMAGLFFLVITPTGLLVRVSGKDLLGLRRAPEATTYWRTRREKPGNMSQQF